MKFGILSSSSFAKWLFEVFLHTRKDILVQSKIRKREKIIRQIEMDGYRCDTESAD